MTEQLTLELAFRPAQGRDDFIVAPSNADAVAWLDRWPNWPAPGLVVHGPEASGKSHLVEVWRARSAALRLEAGELGVGERHAAALLAPALAIEDADRPLDDRAERALFDLLDRTIERRGVLLFTARAPAQRWPTRLPDLRSRLAALPNVAIGPAEDALIEALLVKLFDDRGIALDRDSAAYAALRIERSCAAARRLVEVVDRAALAARRPVTVPLLREVLRGMPAG